MYLYIKFQLIFAGNRLTRYYFYCFNCVIRKKLFVKMKIVYFRGL